MSRLTRRQSIDLTVALQAAERAYQFLNRPTTIVAMQRSAQTTTLDFTLPDGRVACEVEKFIGSPLCGLITAIQELRAMLGLPRMAA